MPAASTALDYIYEGVWLNWSKGPILGLTLTVNPYSGSIISPALAVFISIAGTQLWNLIQFALHQIRATPSPRSLLYHQQQTILRNTASDLNALWRLARVGLAWRHQRDGKVLTQSLPLILWAFLHFSLIVLAGLFSSWLLETDDRVLSRSPWCGQFDTTYAERVYNTDVNNTADIQLSMEFTNYFNSYWANVQQHVEICETSVEGCDNLPVANLTWKSDVVSGGCPFDKSVCHPDVNDSISFDTGYLSSNVALGFNARNEDRISFRMVAECAPLDDAAYTTGWQSAASDNNTTSAYKAANAFYGASLTNNRNATYTLVQQELSCDQRAITPAYSLNSEYCPPGGSMDDYTSTFDPIPELQLAEADVSLIMLSYINTYIGQVNDPFFSAKQLVNDNNAFCLQQDRALYSRDLPLTTIGCSQQWQVCNTDTSTSRRPSSDQCTPLLALSQTQAMVGSASSLNFTMAQLATVSRMLSAAGGSTFFYVINALSQSTSPPLKARKLMSQSVALAVPDDQWQIETKYWMTILLAYLQQVSVDYSTGRFAADTSYINTTKSSSTDPAQQAAYNLCQNQIVRSKTYRNYNFFAMILVIVIASIIIVLGLTIEDLLGYIRQRNLRYSGVNGKQDMWIANSDLEMLKTIDEAKNGSVWTRSKNGIPVTSADHRVGVHNLRNEHVDVEEGVGVISMAVKRQRSKTMDEGAEMSQAPYSLGHNQHGVKGCATCSTFELSRTSSGESSRELSPVKGPLVWQNRFVRPFERDGIVV